MNCFQIVIILGSLTASLPVIRPESAAIGAGVIIKTLRCLDIPESEIDKLGLRVSRMTSPRELVNILEKVAELMAEEG